MNIQDFLYTENFEDIKTYYYIYFIENHDINSLAQVNLSKKYNEVDDLELVKQEQIYENKEDNSKYIISIYRFKLFYSKISSKIKSKKKFEVELSLQDIEDKKFITKILITSFDRDLFLYDLKFEENKSLFGTNKPPKSIELPLIQQFEIYVLYLKNDIDKKNKNIEHKNLILSTESLIFEKDLKFNFSFYLIIFIECYQTEYIKNYLLEFKPEKGLKIEKIKEEKLKEIFNILEMLEEKPNLILDNIKDEEKLKYEIILYTIILFFNYLFKNEKFRNLLENKKIKNYVYKALVNYNYLFERIKLTKEQMQNVIDASSNFNELSKGLTYNNDILELLELIISNFEKINFLYKLNENENLKNESKETIKPRIDLEEISNPKLEDNIKEISNKYICLLELQKEKTKKIFIKFKSSLIEKYISIFEDINIEFLIYIKDLIKYIKKNNNKFDIKNKDINKIIHETGLKLSSEGKLTNIEILNFIKKDIYYNSKKFNRKSYRSLNVFDCLRLDSINKTFIKEWKKFDWNNIFNEQYNDFLKKISNFVRNFKDFNILLKLFNISKNEKQKDFEKNSLLIMQSKLIDLLKIYNPEESSYFENDLLELILFSDQKDAEIEKFLNEYLNNYIKFNLLNKIYSKLLLKSGGALNQKTINIIINYFNKNLKYLEPDSLLYLIQKCPNSRKYIFQNIQRYNFKKDEFFKVEESDRLKVFNGLSKIGLLSNIEIKDTQYIENIRQISISIINDIKNGNVLYKDINSFYDANKKEELNSRLISINMFNNKEEKEKLIEKINDYISKINQVLENLQLIYQDLNEFFYNKENETILKLITIINDIKESNLNCYEKKYVDIYKQLIEKYKQKAEFRALKKKSLFFVNIFKNNKIKYKNNDEICIKETEEYFDKLKIIFNKNGIELIDKDLLNLCMSIIKGKKEEEINNEIIILEKIFDKEINNLNYNKKEILKSLNILSKKEDIINISLSISLFIEKIGAIKDNFYNKIKKIILDLKDGYIEQIIIESIKQLKNYYIDIDLLYKKDNNYLNILLKLKEEPDSILYLLNLKIEDCDILYDLIKENYNCNLNIYDILYLKKCVEIMNKLGNEENIKNSKDIDIFNLFKNEIEKNNNNIEILYFTKYINNFSEIKNIIDNCLNNSELFEQKINLISKISIFNLKNIKEKYFEGNYKIIKEVKNNKKEINIKLNIINFLEIKFYAQISKNKKEIKEENNYLINRIKLIEIISKIYDIYCILKEIYINGYPKDIDIIIEIKNLELQCIGYELNTKNPDEIIFKLKSLLNNLKNLQLIAYKEKPLIRYIYGRNFYLMYNILNKKENNESFPLLLLITNNLIKYELQNFSFVQTNNIYEDIINNTEKYLQETLTKNNITLKMIYNDSLIEEKNEESDFKGIFIYNSIRLKKDIFQIYKYLTKNIPIKQNVLLCNFKTSNEELTAFLYRAILCDFNSCFIIGGLEYLDYNIKTKFFELLNYLCINEYKNMKSCLIIFYLDKNNDIYKNLELLKYKNSLNIKLDENILNNIKLKEKSKEDININDIECININKDNKKIEELEKLNKELKEEINKLKTELEEEKSKNKILNELIEKLKKINQSQNNNVNENQQKDKIIELMEELREKEKEIKELKEIKSRFPFELLPNENLMSLNFISYDEDIFYSIICKNTDKFNKIENKLYEKYPECIGFKNNFLVNGNEIDNSKTIQENNIINNDVIIFQKSEHKYI